MAVRIRLSRGGSKKRPFYRVVAADQRAPRDGRFIEKLGTYNPLLPQDHEQRLVINEERVKYWLGVGAQPTERLEKLFSNLGLVKAPALRTAEEVGSEGQGSGKNERERSRRCRECRSSFFCRISFFQRFFKEELLWTADAGFVWGQSSGFTG